MNLGFSRLHITRSFPFILKNAIAPQGTGEKIEEEFALYKTEHAERPVQEQTGLDEVVLNFEHHIQCIAEFVSRVAVDVGENVDGRSRTAEQREQQAILLQNINSRILHATDVAAKSIQCAGDEFSSERLERRHTNGR